MSRRRLQRMRPLSGAFILLGLIIFLIIQQWLIFGPTLYPSVCYHYNNLAVYTLNTITSTYTYPVKNLSNSDYRSLMNIKSFQFDLLNECTSSLILLVVIHSAPKNFDRRKCIRETWGQNRENLKVVFLLGYVDDLNLQRKLEEENNRHGDFVQGNFLDAYKNLTYKHVMAFKYAIYHCPQAKYILKTDDDVFVNMPTMMDFLTMKLSPYGAKNLLLCSLNVNAAVMRVFYKWSVSFDEFRDRYYPPFCAGWSVLYSPDVLFTLYGAAQKSEFFWIEDVLITGLLVKNENIQHTDSHSVVLSPEVVEEIAARGGSYNNLKMFLYGPPQLSIEEMYLLWNFVSHQDDKI